MNWINDVIANWPADKRAELYNEVLELVSGEYTVVDVHAAGSRVFGGHSDVSDLDIIVWVAEKDVYHFLRPLIFYGLRAVVRAETLPVSGVPWRKAYIGAKNKPAGRDLPTYSLMTGNTFGTGADVKFHQDLRKAMRSFSSSTL